MPSLTPDDICRVYFSKPFNIFPHPDVPEDEVYMVQGNQAGKLTLQKNHIRDLREKYEKELGMAVTQAGQVELMQMTNGKEDTFLDAVRKEVDQKMAMIHTNQELVAVDKIFLPVTSGIQAIYLDEETLHADPDRPTLAERLDRAEEERDDARRQLEAFERQRNHDQYAYAALEARLSAANDRATRAEAMAKKVDFAIADLEKCRRDMGDKRFNELCPPPVAERIVPIVGAPTLAKTLRQPRCATCNGEIMTGDKYAREKSGFVHLNCASPRGAMVKHKW